MGKNDLKKVVWGLLLVLTFVGGLVHVLQPFGYNLLTMFGSYAGLVQFLAGAATIIVVLEVVNITRMVKNG